MGRSNNQLRRTAKSSKTGKVYIPKIPKSKTLRNARKQRVTHALKNSKLSYNKIRTKQGKVQNRKFQAGGYNNSGKFGKAAGAKALARKSGSK